jgi:hypothetical protein
MTRVKRVVCLALVLLALIGIGSVAATDTTPPEISIFSPQNGAIYLLNQPVLASWIVIDPEPSSGIKLILAMAPNGSPVDTATVGSKKFIIIAEDNAGNTASQTVDYGVAYRALAVDPVPEKTFVNTKVPQLEVKVGQIIPFSFAIKDFSNTIVVKALGTLSVIDAQTRAVVSIEKGVIGVFHYDSGASLSVINWIPRLSIRETMRSSYNSTMGSRSIDTA